MLKTVLTAPLVAGLFAFATAFSASADSMTWSFQSDYPYTIHIELYSQDRNHVWPGDGEIWVLDDYDVHDISISCNSGEKICYGAWPAGDTSRYWGAGYDGVEACDDCCNTCGGGELPVRHLD